MATLAYTENYIKPLIFVLFTLYGLAQYIVFPTLVAVVGNWFSKSKRGLVSAAYGTSGNVGNIIGFQTASIVLHLNDNHWGGLFYALSAFFLVNTLIAFFVLNPSPKLKGIVIDLKEKIK